MGIGAISYQLVVERLEFVLQSLGVLDDLLLVLLELWGHGLVERDGKSGDCVVMWAALVTWEDGEVDWALEVVQSLLASLWVRLAHTLAEEDHSTSWASEGLVGGGSDNVGILERSWNNFSGNKPGDVCHVNDEVCANKIGNLPHTLVVDKTAVSRSTGNQDLWSVHESVGLKLVIINDARLKVYTVWERLKVGRDSRDPAVKLVTSIPPDVAQLTFAVGSGNRGSNDRREEGRDP